MISDDNDKIVKDIFKTNLSKYGYSRMRVSYYDYGKINIDDNKRKLINFYVINRYADGVDNVSELIYRLYNNVEKRPVCIKCGARVTFNINKRNYNDLCRSCKGSLGGTALSKRLSNDNELKEKFRQNGIIHNKKMWNVSKDERIILCNKMSNGWHKKFLNMSPEERNNYSKECSNRAYHSWESKSLEEKKRFAETQKRVWENRNKEDYNKWWNTCIATRQPNYTSKHSKQEQEIFDYVHTLYKDAKHWYRDNRYGNYECDIYVPSKDAFIECQYFITHGGHPFDETNIDDLVLVEKLKNNAFCHNDYKTFSERDPLKRKIAKENNLNFLELWHGGKQDEQIVHDWLKKLPDVK